ncbi:MAG: TM0106 family RecB-like putative nuclease, partial [Gammaproteobacteria bacterium]
VAFLECEHLTATEVQSLGDEVLRGKRVELDESADLFARKGDEHERAYLSRLRAEGHTVVDIAADGGTDDERVARTLAAMRAGAEVIYQAMLRDGPLLGHADFLRRIDGDQSTFGPWSYEVADTKLARSPKAKFLVQLAFYSHLVTVAQGLQPKRMHVVLGDHTERAYGCADYMHYFQALLSRFLDRVGTLSAGAASETYPLPCAHCGLCRWAQHCEAQRVRDDHLCQVANITRVQWGKLEAQGIDTMGKLATLPASTAIANMRGDIFARLRSQAELQERAARTGKREWLVLPLDPEERRGFYRLPKPDLGDVFFDMEGDPLEDGGLEYLFGVWYLERGAWTFQAFWGHDRAEERLAFEGLMDFVTERRRKFPGAHVYHYASYEESALKRLASWHATREVEVDNLLREGVLVDLYKVVREGIRISEPSYSIKSVEHFYRPAREGEVQSAGASIVYYERWRETHEPQLLQDIADYNRDDVESTQQLRDWLLTLRPSGLRWKERVDRRADEDGGDAAPLTWAQEAERRLVPYREWLVDTLPLETSRWTEQDRAAELTYQLLDFHRRADKPAYWALYARKDMTEEDLAEDPECLAGLQLDLENPPRPDKRSTVYTYLVPEQETKLRTGVDCTRTDTGQGIGALTFDEEAGRVQLKVGPKKEPLPPRLHIGPSRPIGSDTIVDAIFRFADSKLAHDSRYPALERLLLREPPKLKGWSVGQPIIAPGQDILAGSLAAAEAMDHTCLYVQGPPGSGKTYTGSRMVACLLAKGWRVGITSNSHKVINHMLSGVMGVLSESGHHVHAVKKCSATKPETEFDGANGAVQNLDSNADVLASGARLVAGTAWLFSDPAADQRFDVLFVDEAGQVALANLLAAGTCARNIVLLGDQMQLSQPVQGVHPGRSGDSALDYLLDGAATIPPDRGIFLATTHRLHPTLCRFISDAVYDGRLEPEEGNVRRALVLDGYAHRFLATAGIVHVPLEHQGCSQRSKAEADMVLEIVTSALQQHYTDRAGRKHRMSLANVLVVAPYNVQVNQLKRVLPAGARVGTVDKFQGQEAELVIVSMTTSSEQDLPRHLEFLYSKNRLNVAISRAKCLAIVIASPALMTIHCHTPQEMALVNTLCWMAHAGHAS